MNYNIYESKDDEVSSDSKTDVEEKKVLSQLYFLDSFNINEQLVSFIKDRGKEHLVSEIMSQAVRKDLMKTSVFSMGSCCILHAQMDTKQCPPNDVGDVCLR
jgi:hypothetical protein